MPVQISTAKPIKSLELVKKEKHKKTDWKKAKEVAEYFDVSLPTISRWTNREDDPLPCRWLSGILRYDFNKVKEWEERNMTKNY